VRPICELAADDLSGVAVPTFLVAGWMMESAPSPAFTLLPMPLALQPEAFAAPRPVLPMTMHMRLWKWPALVGPINVAGSRPQMTPTPQELPTVDSGLYLPVMPTWPRGDDQIASTPTYALDPTPTIPRPEQELLGLRNVWTRHHPTLPMWAPEIVGGFVGGSNVRQVLSGVTRDGTGVALAACTVKAFRADQIVIPFDQDVAMVATTVSDGGGAYTLEVRENAPHQLTGYKTGSPDLAGITLNTVLPVAT
jgi:hypothetical protein